MQKTKSMLRCISLLILVFSYTYGQGLPVTEGVNAALDKNLELLSKALLEMDAKTALSFYAEDYISYGSFAEPVDLNKYGEHLTEDLKYCSIRGCQVVPPDETILKRWQAGGDIYELGTYGFTQTGDPLKPYTSLQRGHYLRMWKKVGDEFKMHFYMNQLQYHIDIPQSMSAENN